MNWNWEKKRREKATKKRKNWDCLPFQCGINHRTLFKGLCEVKMHHKFTDFIRFSCCFMKVFMWLVWPLFTIYTRRLVNDSLWKNQKSSLILSQFSWVLNSPRLRNSLCNFLKITDSTFIGYIKYLLFNKHKKSNT